MQAPVVDAGYLKEVEAARRAIRGLIVEKQCAPILLRLSFHDAGTYDPKSRTGGPQGCIRSELMYTQACNAGLKIGIDLLEPIKSQCPRLTYADLYQLAGVVAVEATGGPSIAFKPGRKDSLAVTPDDRLPDANKGPAHLREVFGRLGFTDRDIVAISGAHTLGRGHKERSGFEGPWTEEPLKFDNTYYKELLRGERAGILQMPTDKCLVADAGFRPFVELYARDQDAFFKDYVEAHTKMSVAGCKDTSPAFWGSEPSKAEASSGVVLGQAAIGFAATALVLALGYMNELRRKTK